MAIKQVFQIMLLSFVLNQPNAVYDRIIGQAGAARESQDVQSLGPFDLRWDRWEKRQEILAKMRAFLWEKLSRHEPGTVRFTSYTLEGDPTTWDLSVVAVEGHWCIQGEYVSKSYFGLKKPKTTRGRTDYHDAERLDAHTNLPIPQAEQRGPQTYRLQLKGPTRNQDMTL